MYLLRIEKTIDEGDGSGYCYYTKSHTRTEHRLYSTPQGVNKAKKRYEKKLSDDPSVKSFKLFIFVEYREIPATRYHQEALF